MSHPHKQQPKPKKIKQDLIALQETREMNDEAKAELLRHNPVLTLHEPHNEAPKPVLETTNYIKQPEDFERIARNRVQNDNVAVASTANPVGLMQSGIQGLITMQLQILSAMTKSWSDMVDMMILARPSYR